MEVSFIVYAGSYILYNELHYNGLMTDLD
jgi:hypothetical protein